MKFCSRKFMSRRNTYYLLLTAFLAITGTTVSAQKDTLSGTGEEVVVTATRSERKLSNVAVPVTLISHRTIQQTGSLKLQDIIQEQTGIVIVNSALASSLNGYPNPFGQGVQMLGLDPAYTAILLDGEPLIGRNAGILKLGRLATGNIQQVEIVKGPSSSLYGSEAMAGVINIITQQPQSEIVGLQLHHATNNTWGGTVSYSNRFKKTGIQFFLNRYSSSGYDLDPTVYGKTIDPSRDWTANLKITQDLSKNMQLLVSLRDYDSKQNNNYQIYWMGAPAIVKGATIEKDQSVFAQLKWNLSNTSRLFIRTFYDRYQNNPSVKLEKDGTTFDETNFNESIVKPEIQYEKNKAGKSKYIAGLGAYFEMIDASRYAGKQNLTTLYAFTQEEWYLLNEKLTVIAGLRADKRDDYDLQVSPRLAVAYKPNSNWKFTASAGWGFKAPDFRHMYLSFVNTQIGYSLIGYNVLYQQLQLLQSQGQLPAGTDITAYQNTGTLKPETSFGTHLGAKYQKNRWSIDLGIFRNDINNLIDVYTLPFNKTNNQNIFSYHNVNKVYTQGLEADIKYRLFKNLYASVGYQFLDSKDKQVLKDIEDGKVLKRDPDTYITTYVKKSDYFGLWNRSRHSGNIKLLWDDQHSGWNAYVRAVYRGKYGYSDKNGDNIADDDREMVKGYWLMNIAAAKTVINGLQVQAGIENLFNYTNPIPQPNYSGRIYFLNINYSIQHLFNTKTTRK